MVAVDSEGLAPTGPYEDLHRGAGTMIIVRWVAVPWVLLQIIAYEIPYPRGYRALAFAFLSVLVVGNTALMLAHRGPRGRERARTIGVLGLVLDVALLSAFVWLYAFDYQTQIWAVLFIAPLEGAILFQLRGALWAWAAIAISYAFRDIWGAARYDNPLIWNSISFRMGIGGIIALVAGLMARDLLRQRSHLADAVARLQQVDGMRSGLISMLGHDVRNPLTVIRGAVSTLIDKEGAVSSKDRLMLLAAADRQAHRLESLASDLLDLARIDQGRLHLEPGSVPLAEAVRDSLTYVPGADGITVECDDDLIVRADPRRLEQVIVNLVSNALAHGAPPVEITARRADHAAILDVTDHGPGVPPKELAGLFEPFNADRKSGSVGYGLAIVKALVEAQGGSVEYASNGDDGARFRVTLPLS
jgi:signal transduction histidine kinase